MIHYLEIIETKYIYIYIYIYMTKQQRNITERCVTFKRIIYNYNCGARRFQRLQPNSISSSRPTPRRKKCPRTNEGNPDYQNVLSRTTLSSAGQNHRRGRRHVTQGNPLEDPKRDSKPYGLAIRAWQKRNPRRSCHLRIKYPQLTP